jgi:hypothetical protein
MMAVCPGLTFSGEKQADFDKKLDPIPKSIYDNIISVLAVGHIKAIHGIIQSIHSHDSDFAAALKELTDAYDFNALRQIFKYSGVDR